MSLGWKSSYRGRTNGFRAFAIRVANRALFLDADYIAYHESKKEDSLDGYFWEQLFRLFSPEKKIKFLAAGSKSEVIQRYEIYKEEDNGKSLFLLDRDWDDLLGKVIADKCVIYTYGYSYENDICVDRSIEDTVLLYCLQQDDRRFISDSIKNIIEKNKTSLRRLVRIDRTARLRGIAGISSANYRQFLLSQAYGREPAVSKQEVREFVRLSSKKMPRSRRSIRESPDWRRSLLGHFVFTWFYQSIAWLVSAYSDDVRLRKRDIKRIMISMFLSRLNEPEGEKHQLYYRSAIGAVDAK